MEDVGHKLVEMFAGKFAGLHQLSRQELDRRLWRGHSSGQVDHREAMSLWNV